MTLFEGDIPALSLETGALRFYLPEEPRPALVPLPWEEPLQTWNDHGVQFIPVKSGLSRHIVRFIESGGRRFAIKETTFDAARREFAAYRQLSRRAIRTLLPVGIVARNEGQEVADTTVGRPVAPRDTGYLITELMGNVVPDAYLFKRGFSPENRARIWDVVVQLFVQLHSNGIYWGDASLANMLIHFSTEEVPQLGPRTRLRAVLADAETVEIRPSLSDSLRMADVEFFLESMLWMEADLRASGIVRDPMVTQPDQHYIVRTYRERYAVELEMRSFELLTRIDVDTLLGDFDVEGYGKLLLQHIQEHKWYLSERQRREVPLTEAAEDWYQRIFKPVCAVFNEYGLLKYFPEKTASSLYVEIMEHKYFMSQQEQRDVGLIRALEDYLARFSHQEPYHLTIGSIVKALTSLFRGDMSDDAPLVP